MSDVTMGICHGVLGWGQVEQMTSSADPATVPLANREFFGWLGVQITQMPREKLSSHTHSQDPRSPWPAQTAFILHMGEAVVTMGVHTEGITQTKV